MWACPLCRGRSQSGTWTGQTPRWPRSPAPVENTGFPQTQEPQDLFSPPQGPPRVLPRRSVRAATGTGWPSGHRSLRTLPRPRTRLLPTAPAPAWRHRGSRQRWRRWRCRRGRGGGGKSAGGGDGPADELVSCIPASSQVAPLHPAGPATTPWGQCFSELKAASRLFSKRVSPFYGAKHTRWGHSCSSYWRKKRDGLMLALPHIVAPLMSPWQRNRWPWTDSTKFCLEGKAGRPSHWWWWRLDDSITRPSCEPASRVRGRVRSALVAGETEGLAGHLSGTISSESTLLT